MRHVKIEETDECYAECSSTCILNLSGAELKHLGKTYGSTWKKQQLRSL